MKKNWKWAAAAAGVCLVVAGAVLVPKWVQSANAPNPPLVQVGNPLVSVNSVAEMEQMLDFTVPVLDKEVKAYFVIVSGGRGDIGRISYADGGEFRVRYGSGDVSGIYGGVQQSAVTIQDTAVTYYAYEDTRYALWEKDGFTYSLTGGDNLAAEVTALLG